MVELKIICSPPSASSLPTKHEVASWTNHGVTTYFQAQLICKYVFEEPANLFGKAEVQNSVVPLRNLTVAVLAGVRMHGVAPPNPPAF
jgi:hypothetical protein